MFQAAIDCRTSRSAARGIPVQQRPRDGRLRRGLVTLLSVDQMPMARRSSRCSACVACKTASPPVCRPGYRPGPRITSGCPAQRSESPRVWQRAGDGHLPSNRCSDASQVMPCTEVAASMTAFNATRSRLKSSRSTRGGAAVIALDVPESDSPLPWVRARQARNTRSTSAGVANAVYEVFHASRPCRCAVHTRRERGTGERRATPVMGKSAWVRFPPPVRMFTGQDRKPPPGRRGGRTAGGAPATAVRAPCSVPRPGGDARSPDAGTAPPRVADHSRCLLPNFAPGKVRARRTTCPREPLRGPRPVGTVIFNMYNIN